MFLTNNVQLHYIGYRKNIYLPHLYLLKAACNTDNSLASPQNRHNSPTPPPPSLPSKTKRQAPNPYTHKRIWVLALANEKIVRWDFETGALRGCLGVSVEISACG